MVLYYVFSFYISLNSKMPTTAGHSLTHESMGDMFQTSHTAI